MTQARRFQTRVSVAKETTWGTGVSPDIGIPVNELKEAPQYERIIDSGFRGVASSNYRAQQGVGHGEVQFGGFAYPTEIGAALNSIFGAEVKTGAGPYAHAMSIANTPPSYTIETDVTGGANGALRYTGAKIGQLAFSFAAAGGGLTYSSTWMSKIPTKVTAVNPTIAEDAPWETWRATITSVGLTTNIISADFTLERELQFVHTGQNTQDPFSINQGPLAISGKFIVAAVDLAVFDLWKAFTQQALTIAFTYGAGAAARTFSIVMTAANLADGPVEIDRGNIGITIGSPFLAIHNSTDVGPGVVTVTNGRSTVY